MRGFRYVGFSFWLFFLFLGVFAVLHAHGADSTTSISAISKETVKRTIRALLQTHGETHRFRIEKGVSRAAWFWRASDGRESDFEAFCKKYFISDPAVLEETCKRIETNFELIKGSFYRITRGLYDPLELTGIHVVPIDYLFSRYSPDAHLTEDLFFTKIAFAILLNFPHYSLEEKQEKAGQWNRKQWAMAAAGDIFTARIPPEISQKVYAVDAAVNTYIHNYHIYPGRLLDRHNNPIYQGNEKLVLHWGIRDQLQVEYNSPGDEKKQDVIYRVMLRVLDQSIPKVVISNPEVYWNPYSNQVFRQQNKTLSPVESAPEGGERYQYIKSVFKGQRLLDPYHPDAPTVMDRVFRLERKIPAQDAERLFISILKAPQVKKLAQWIQKRLHRPLRPYDIFYNAFSSGFHPSRDSLDQRLREKYPDAAAFQADIPTILQKIGFPQKDAEFIASHIVIESTKGFSRGGWRDMRDDKSHVRITIPTGGMDYKTFRMALHELGHDVELGISLGMIDYYLLRGVPNMAFSEAFAMMLAAQADQLLGIDPNQEAEDRKTLETFWMAYTTSGTALVEMKMWQWLYRHPEASVPQVQEAVLRISKEVWNQYFASIFNEKDVPLLSIFSHLVIGVLYFPDYPLGEVITLQVNQYMKGKNRGTEMMRMCRLGAVTPGYWMQEAVGAPISAEPLFKATEAALKGLEKK